MQHIRIVITLHEQLSEDGKKFTVWLEQQVRGNPLRLIKEFKWL